MPVLPDLASLKNVRNSNRANRAHILNDYHTKHTELWFYTIRHFLTLKVAEKWVTIQYLTPLFIFQSENDITAKVKTSNCKRYINKEFIIALKYIYILWTWKKLLKYVQQKHNDCIWKERRYENYQRSKTYNQWTENITDNIESNLQR